MTLDSVSPTTGDVLKSYPETTPAQLDDILARVTEAQRGWGGASFAEYSACMRRAAAVLRERAEDYARLAFTSYLPGTVYELEESTNLVSWGEVGFVLETLGPHVRARPAVSGLPMQGHYRVRAAQ